ncbi:MAG: histidine--tRNA ligase [Candidatus Dormibacteria bacterium]
MPPIARPRGTEDLLPARLAEMGYVANTGLAVANSYGYQQMATPIFESTELFARGVGDTTDVVRKEMYTFTDRGGRSLTLRPENTAPVLRAFQESELRQLPAPVRLSYSGPMFRYDRPGRGRLRQFHQFGVEVIGDQDPEVDAEVIAVAWDWLSRLGVQGVTLELNSLGDSQCRPQYRQALLQHFAPHLATLPQLDQERLRRNPLRILDSRELDSAELLASAPASEDYLCDDCRAALARVRSALDAYAIPYRMNPRLVRGLDYYVRTTFEVWHQQLQGAQNALFGGGRYDGLSELLGYPPAPGVGFAAGLERVAMMAPGLPQAAPVQVAVVSTRPEDLAPALAVARRLRQEGFRVLTELGPKSLRSKMRFAERSGAEAVCILGEEEEQQGVASLRQLSSGEQLRLPQEELGTQLRLWGVEAGARW